ncbi:MAG: methyltransferase domain-containing protein [Pseudomonadota bacterium]
MEQKIKKILKRFVLTLGNFVESVIEKFKKMKISVGKKSGLQPILSLESQLPDETILKIINDGAKRVLIEALPKMQGITTLEVADGGALVSEKLMQQGAKLALFCEIGNVAGEQGDIGTGLKVKGGIANLPFNNAFFDYFVANLATPRQGDLNRGMKEFSRVLTPGGQGVIVDFHPYSMFAKEGSQRMRSIKTTINGIEDYYKLIKSTGLRVVNIRELFIDDKVRSFFAPDAIEAYRNLKGSPFLVFVYVYKPKGKGRM